MGVVVSKKSDRGLKEKEKGGKPNPLSEDGGWKATEKVMGIAPAAAMATTITMPTITLPTMMTMMTKAASGGVEEGLKDVSSFGEKKWL